MKHNHLCFSSNPKANKKEVGDKIMEVSYLLDEFQDIVSNNLLDSLPLVRNIIYQMDLIPGASLPNKAAHKMTIVESEDLNKQVQELLHKGLIQESLSPCVLLAVLAPNKNREWRMCIDSQVINNITIKYRFPLLRMDDNMHCLSGVEYFTKIDFKSGYHKIQIRDKDEWKKTLKT